MRDRRFVAAHRGGLLTNEHHLQLMAWAHACAAHVLPLGGKPPDERLAEALRVAKEWEKGKASVGDTRKAAVAAHAAAREAGSPAAKAAARSAGHAVAVAHMADHALGAALYALKAARAAGRSMEAERNWQNDRLPPGIRRLVLSARAGKGGEPMKELIVLYAKYNSAITEEIIRIVAGLGEGEFVKERNTYFGSIMGLVRHMASGSWHYLRAIDFLTGGNHCAGLPDLDEIKASFERSTEECLRHLKTLTAVFEETAEGMTDERLRAGKRGFRIYNGRAIDVTAWQYFLQHMTHQIHHQGQLSQLFDELGIEHEFGMTFPLLPDSAAGSPPAVRPV